MRKTYPRAVACGLFTFSLSLLAVACADTSMSGNTAKPKAPSSASLSAGNKPQVDSADSTPQTASTDAGNVGATPLAQAAAVPLLVTKTSGGGLEDKPVTVSVAVVDASGRTGPAETVTVDSGSGGSQSIPNLCTGGPVKIAVSIEGAAGGGGLGGLLGGLSAGKTIATGQGSSSSQITFDPSTCMVSQLLSGNKGDTLSFSCPNKAPVTVVAGT